MNNKLTIVFITKNFTFMYCSCTKSRFSSYWNKVYLC